MFYLLLYGYKWNERESVELLIGMEKEELFFRGQSLQVALEVGKLLKVSAQIPGQVLRTSFFALQAFTPVLE